MKGNSFITPKQLSKGPINFPPLPTKSNIIFLDQVQKHTSHNHLQSPLYGYNSELPLNAFPSQDPIPSISKFKPPSNMNYYMPNSFNRIERSSQMNCVNTLVRRPSIEKKIDVPSTQNNFSKTTKKKLFLKQKSFDRLSISNNSIAINNSLTNLNEIENSQLRGTSFMEIKPKSPLRSRKNLIMGPYQNAQYNKAPSISGFMNFPSESELKTFGYPHYKWDKPNQFELTKPNIHSFNFDIMNIKRNANIPSFSNLESIQRRAGGVNTNKGNHLLQMVMPDYQKTPLNGKFPSMKVLESGELEPELGKRSKPESNINLPSLNGTLKKLKPSKDIVYITKQSSQGNVSLNIPRMNPIKEKSLKPTSTTSLESKI